jgi:hypothetical protein
MIHTQYACLEMPCVSSKEQLVELLKVYAKQILEMPEVQQDSPFDYLQQDVEGLSQEEAITAIVSQLLHYTDIEDVTSQGASVVVQAHYEGDADNYDLFEAISKFLFPKSSKPYFLMRSAAADRAGAYSHQWIGYWKEGEVVVELTESYFDRLFVSSADPHQNGSINRPVGLA